MTPNRNPNLKTSVVDKPERSGTPFRYLLFSRNARSGTYCQISRNAFYLPFRHLFTMVEDDDYELMTPRCFTYLQPVAESCTIGAHFSTHSFSQLCTFSHARIYKASLQEIYSEAPQLSHDDTN